MRAKNGLRGLSSKGINTKSLVTSVIATVAASARGAMVVNPTPDTVFTAMESLPRDQEELLTLQAELNANSSEWENGQNEIELQVTAINEINSYFLELTGYEGKSKPPEVILGPGHFVGTIFLTHAIAEGEIIGPDATYTESEATIEGTDLSYFGFSINPSEDSSLDGPLYGWVRLDGTGSVTDLNAPVRSEVVTVNWAYDDSGQAVIAGSTNPIPEPSTLGLAAAGLLLAGAAWQRRRMKPGRTAARSQVPRGRWQVWEAQRKECPMASAPGREPCLGIWVVVAGEPQTIVGMAMLREADPSEMLHVPKEEGVLLEIEMEPAWDEGPAAEALLAAALTRARQTSARQVLFGSGKDHLVKLAGRLGFAKAARKETHHGRAKEAVAWLKARYQKALARNPVEVRPIREAKLEAVQRLVAASRLLKVEQVQERGPGVSQGFDAAYSFFAGDADRPAALILGFEHQGRVRLHVRVRDAEARDFPRHGMIGLLIAFLDAVAAAGVEEVSFVTRSGAQADFGTLARRWGARSVEFLETLRLAL